MHKLLVILKQNLVTGFPKLFETPEDFLKREKDLEDNVGELLLIEYCV